MTTLRVFPVDARRRALPERFVVSLERDGRQRSRAECDPPASGADFTRPEVLPHRNHLVRVESRSFRTSEVVLDIIGDRDVEMLCMLQNRNVQPRTPDYASLPASLQDRLATSVGLDSPTDCGDRRMPSRALTDRVVQELRAPVERQLPARDKEGFAKGSRRFYALSGERKAGLLNLFAKMNAVLLPDESRPWSHVLELEQVDRDRVHARIRPCLHIQAVYAAIPGMTSGVPCFKHVDGFLHRPPKGYTLHHSLKTLERYGNLQLTFFTVEGERVADRVDADVDDAAGIEHAEQVTRNRWRKLARCLFGWFARNLPEGTTHPYDIHQILFYHQGQPGNHQDSRCDGKIGRHQPLYTLEFRTNDGVTHLL